mmetsp:Transcript_2978/g.4260  ORF Transcript_2978/g.4260 Transcript_2978/m.4260 type:complete len:386 (-) Transcript_2978:232-1389(-)
MIDVGHWKWTILADEARSIQALPIIKSAKCSINRAIELLILNSTKSRCEKSKQVFSACKSKLNEILSIGHKRPHTNPMLLTCQVAVAVGPHLLLLGGLDRDENIDVLLIIRLELDGEREERNNAEIDARLVQKRRQRELEEKRLQEERLREEESRKNRETLLEDNEKKKMSVEDYLSSLPPKSVAPAVTLKGATSRTIWVEWPKVTVNSRGMSLHDDEVEYRLFVRGRFVDLQDGQAVVFQAQCSDFQPHYIQSADFVDGIVEAKIIKRHAMGMFDLVLPDGEIVINIPRKRIAPLNIGWELVFVGRDETEYLYDAVPQRIVETEKDFFLTIEFALETVGTEMPIDEPSLPSTIRRFSTNGCKGAALDYDSTREVEGYGKGPQLL